MTLDHLPDWTDWDDHTRMKILATYRHWHLFDDGGKPRVLKRRRLKLETEEAIRYVCDEEVCDLYGSGEDMTQEARDQLRLAWAELTDWRKDNR